MIGLGRMLAEARADRGVSLEEAERDTRISRRYLLALEEEQFAVFPVQVQARGFLRLYAQYLTLDPGEMLALFPHEGAIDEADGLIHADRIFRDVEPARGLPRIDARSPTVRLSALVGVLLLGCAVIGSVCASGRERAAAGLTLLARGGENAALPVPDVRESTVTAAVATLQAAGITPLVIEVEAERVAAGLVIRQSPAPGSVVSSGSDVTLIVSKPR